MCTAGGGGGLLALQQGGAVEWVHTDPVTKSQRLTNQQGQVTAALEFDPFGGETSRSVNSQRQPRRYTTYERDTNGRDYAEARTYHAWFSRFDQPDPYDGSYNLADPQSFNRYAYVQNDPVNFTDPSGLFAEGDNIACFRDMNGDIRCGNMGSVTVTAPFDALETNGTILDMLSLATITGGGGSGGSGGGGVPNPPQTKPDALTSNQDVLKDMYCLWKKGGYGTRPTERSMWVTKQGDSYGSVPWPWSAATKTESWKGPWPAGSVAIAHTHPDRNLEGSRASPKPSTTGGNTGRGDQGTADKTGLPVYVVTGQAIWKAVPNAKNPVQVAGNEWWKPFEKAKVKCDE